MSIETKIKRNIDLAPYTTFKIGGPAKFFVEVKFAEELEEAINWAKKNKEEVYLLGGGSNVLVSDKGVNGLVVRFVNNDVNDMNPRFHVGAGVPLSYLISHLRSKNLSGLEWGFGIPRATIGGCIRGNAGAFGKQMADVVETVEAYDAKKGKFEFFSNKDCEFDYRTSIFKKNNHLLVWGATLKLVPDSSENIKEKVEKYIKLRDDKQPRLPNAGSIFKNLFMEDIKIQNEKVYDHIKENKVDKEGRVGAGYLIDVHGLKGKKIKNAKVSLEHANFIVNTGGATAEDVLELINFIKKEIKIRFNIELEEEVQMIGFED